MAGIAGVYAGRGVMGMIWIALELVSQLEAPSLLYSTLK